jgi:hypothetical protein
MRGGQSEKRTHNNEGYMLPMSETRLYGIASYHSFWMQQEEAGADGLNSLSLSRLPQRDLRSAWEEWS